MEFMTDIKEENLEETIKALKEKLNERNTVIEKTRLKLDKAAKILSYWFNEYDFSEAPDPRAALRYGDSDSNDIRAAQSAKWFFEYDNIQNFIDIVNDYVHESKDALDKAC